MPNFPLVGFETTTGKQAELLIDNGELRVSGSSSGGVPAKAPTATDATMASVGVFGSNDNGSSFQALKMDSSGHLLVSTSSDNDSLVIKGNDGNDGSGTVRTIKTDASGNLQVGISQQVIVGGNDGDDGTGTNRTVKTDSSGNVNVNVLGVDSGAPRQLSCDSNGNLQVDVVNQPNIKLEDLSSTLDADHANVNRSLATTLKARQTIGDETSGLFLQADANGFLSVRDKNQTVIAPNLNTADTTQLPRQYIVLHDSTNNLMKSAKCDTNANLLVSDEKGRFGMTNGINAKTTLSGSLTETKQVVCVGLDNPASATSINPFKVDADGHLQVDVVSGGGGGSGGAAGVIEGQFVATAPTLSDGDTNNVRLDVNGRAIASIEGKYTTIAPTLTNNQFGNLRMDDKALLLTGNEPVYNTQIGFVGQLFATTGNSINAPAGSYTFSNVIQTQQFMRYNDIQNGVIQLVMSAGAYQSIDVCIEESFDFTDATVPATRRILLSTTNNDFTNLSIPFTTVAKNFKIGIKPTSG